MWGIVCIACAAILAWGVAYCGKNIAIGLIEIAKALREKK